MELVRLRKKSILRMAHDISHSLAHLSSNNSLCHSLQVIAVRVTLGQEVWHEWQQMASNQIAAKVDFTSLICTDAKTLC